LQPGSIHAFMLQVAAQQAAEGVLPHAADKAHWIAQAGGCHGENGRRTAGEGAREGALLVEVIRRGRITSTSACRYQIAAFFTSQTNYPDDAAVERLALPVRGKQRRSQDRQAT
jgi:hypothetical protein